MTETNTLTLNALIASGESISGSIDMSAFAVNKDSFRLFGIIIPTTWNAASLTFQGSIDDGDTWHEMLDATGVAHSVTAVAGAWHTLDPAIFSSVPMVKVRSGTATSPVTQDADRDLYLVLRNL